MSYLVRVKDMLSSAFLPNYEVQVSENTFTKEQDFKLLFLRTASITSRCYHDSYCFDDDDRNTEVFHENQIGVWRQCLNLLKLILRRINKM
jgi:glycogen synthase